jgi:hypothetical protein
MKKKVNKLVKYDVSPVDTEIIVDGKMVHTIIAEEPKYEKEYAIIEKAAGSKLIITPPKKQVKMMLDLFRKNKNHKYSLLYFLTYSGKYQSVNPITWDELETFCKKYTDYLETDGRHNFGIVDNDTKDTVIYDHHNILYVYGNLKEKIEILEKKGYKKVEKITIQKPHGHYFYSENNDTEDELIKNNDWIFTPIKNQDTEFENDDEHEDSLRHRFLIPKWIIEDEYSINDYIRRLDEFQL